MSDKNTLDDSDLTTPLHSTIDQLTTNQQHKEWMEKNSASREKMIDDKIRSSTPTEHKDTLGATDQAHDALDEALRDL